MRKLNYLLTSMIIISVITSCSKDLSNEIADLKSASLGSGVIPIVVEGNANCEEIGFPSLFSSGKADYFNGEFIFEDGTIGWPEGLEVIVTDGKYVTFTYSSSSYCVGSVIVKGGNASNVYFFDGGTKGSTNLTAPSFYNRNGKLIIPELSNLSFCFVECKPKIVIALKTFIKDTSTDLEFYAVSSGVGSEAHSSYLGYNFYNYDITPNVYPLIRQGTAHQQIGTISVTDYLEDGVHYLEIVIDTEDDIWLFLRSYLFVGPEDTYYPDWSGFQFVNAEAFSIHIFKIPFNNIL